MTITNLIAALGTLVDLVRDDLSYRVLNDRNFSFIHKNLLHRVVVVVVVVLIGCLSN